MKWLILTLILLTGCASDIEMDSEKAVGTNEKATFAGGCFWCMEAAFEDFEGVGEVISGYTGGNTEDPTYKEVTSGKTGHYEAIQVNYDSTKISYKELLDIFWKNIDPMDSSGQFVDKGSQYKTAIFYHNNEQKKLALESKKYVSEKLDKEVVTSILPLDVFYPAEEYHQDYYKKRTLQYKIYEQGSGRKSRLKEVWG